MKANRNLIYVVVALGLGLLAAVMSVRYVQDEVAKRSVSEGETATVAVPKQDMEPGVEITSDDLAMRDVPADLLPADAVTPDNFEQFAGRVLRAPVRQGAPLSASSMVPAYDQFSRVIKPGSVGYTLSVDETNSISGMIAPGDHVDILLSVEQDTTGTRVLPLLEDINVLATGTRVGESPPQADDEGNYSNITLELAPVQAERLTVASKAGSLRVMLRQHGDGEPFGLKGLTQKQLLQTAGGRRGVRSNSGVEFIIGGKG